MAARLTTAEPRQVMAALDCRDAINLDGGGSTAMVVRGQVVNHPCDNKKFDAAGERRVANAIVITLAPGK
jgi:exopolysaccharide biosynthesis protein